MLDYWIIEELRKHEKAQEDDRPRIQLPVPEYYPLPKKENVVESDRGVIVIDISPRDDDEEQ